MQWRWRDVRKYGIPQYGTTGTYDPTTTYEVQAYVRVAHHLLTYGTVPVRILYVRNNATFYVTMRKYCSVRN